MTNPGVRLALDTVVYKVDPLHPDEEIISQCAEVILRGGLVAFPTETVYGIGGNGLDPVAVAKIFEAKGRPPDNPLILHVSRPESVEALVEEIPPEAVRLMEMFWPGPLTLILPKSHLVPSIVTGGLPTVAVRMPDHPVAQKLIDACGVPLAAPSANISGRPSATSAEDVLADLNGKVDIILDAGPTEIGIESTLVDLSGDVPRVNRPGGLNLQSIREVLETADVAPQPKYRHYVPESDLYLVTGDLMQQRRKSIFHAIRFIGSGKKVVILASDENAPFYVPFQKVFGDDRMQVIPLGSRCDLSPVAAKLYSSLRRASNELGADVILSETFPEEGIGFAISNRLEMASEGRVVPWFDSASDYQPAPLAILMVCSGNTCRSPMAEGLLRRLWKDIGEPYPIHVASAGVSAIPGLPASREAIEVMAKRGVDLSYHRSKALEIEDVKRADLVITMTNAHKAVLVLSYPEFSHKVFTLSEMISDRDLSDVPDPFGQDLEMYERTADLLEQSLLVLAKRLAGLDV